MAAPAAAKRPYCQAPAAAAAEPNKRHRTAAAPALMDAKPEPEQHEQEEQPLLPGLPDHLAQLCLAPLPPRLLHAVCHPWRRLLYSPSFPPFLSLYAVLDDASASTGGVSFAAYDAVAGRWDDLPAPPMPSSPPRLWHPSFLSRRLPLQSVAAGGRLVVVAGSTRSLAPALPRPVVFDPAARAWRLGPRFPFAPRRWCSAGAARGRVFVAGGVGAGYDASDARSGATWDPASAPASASGWEPIPPMRDARFSRDAAEAVCAAGKVCMVSLRGRGAKEGAVFDLRAARWEDMPPGMLAGWKGPAAAVSFGGDEETTIFVVDEERGTLSAYDWARDRWRTVVESERLKGAAEMAAGGARVCVAAQGGEKVVVIDEAPCRPSPPPPSRRWCAPAPAAAAPRPRPRPRVWEVAAPPGKRVVSLHVLPRMSRAE
ncbi:F-box/kelch-repeat protein SKIP25-like [Miscanthus floridulus]|uniref:F-box/kelch-repeat protein SKIP25-like n=1 Tax=Miscanthus floridulus TaxID=154761 RepID=UPI0034599889